MELWLDTTNQDSVKKCVSLGLLAGVTTNPSIITKDPRSLETIIEALLDCQNGLLAVQIVGADASTIIKQAHRLHNISKKIIVKIPATQAGLEAINSLSKKSILTMATVLYTPTQALLAAKAGANYVAPYVGRIEKSGIDPWKVLLSILRIYENYGISTRILAASLTTTEQILKCAEMGIHAVTIRDSLFESFIAEEDLTKQNIDQFNAEWKNLSKPSKIF